MNNVSKKMKTLGQETDTQDLWYVVF